MLTNKGDWSIFRVAGKGKPLCMPANASGGGAASVRLTYLDRPSNAVTLNVQ